MEINQSCTTDEVASEDVAIVGISCRFPKAANKDVFWKNILDGRECITFMSEEQIKADRHLIGNPYYVPACGLIEDYDGFDAELFGIPESTAEMMTPEHRAFIECAWDVMVDAGYDASSYAGDVAVYGACNPQSIARYGESPNWVTASDPVLEHSQAWCPDALTAYTLYHLGLTGESMTLNALCSGFHSAVHFACQSLLLKQVDMAIAGGVMIRLPHERGYLWAKGKPLSRDGHSRPFDDAATGAAISSGVATFLLKPLADAVADRDHIYAVIKGTAINNNGASSMGFGVFQPDRLAACIAAGLAAADVSSDTVSMVEAVGAGLPISDVVEVEATARAFNTKRKGYCSFGSVKGNIGHAGVASGGASAIKAALSIYHGIIPQSINFDKPNRDIDFDSSPFCMQRQTSSWDPGRGIRRASVNSIGGAGYNAHMLLEQAPTRPKREPFNHVSQLVVLSAHSETALTAQVKNLFLWVQMNPDARLDDLAYTLNMGRRHHRFRWATVTTSVDELRDRLGDDRPSQSVVTAGLGTEKRGLDTSLLVETDRGIAFKELSRRTDAKALFEMARCWVSGHIINRSELFRSMDLHRISLPAYAFQRRRFWRTYWT